MSQRVPCPICQQMIASERINDHLDSGCRSLLAVTPTAKRTSAGLPKPATAPLAGLPKPASDPHVNSNPKSLPLHQQKDVSLTESQKRPKNTYDAPKSSNFNKKASFVPLAERARPTDWDEFKGQNILKGDSILKTLSSNGKLPSLILWGPPGTSVFIIGCGKTTLARIMAKEQGGWYQEFSATVNNIEDIRKAGDAAKQHLRLTHQKCTIFLDEIHRFSKSQQDIFLQSVEKGEYNLLAATTENPSFRVNAALLSRCRVFALNKLDNDAVLDIIRRAASLKCSESNELISEEHFNYLSVMADGDARFPQINFKNCFKLLGDGAGCRNYLFKTCNVAKFS